MINLLVLGGYARSGKSSSMKILSDLGFQTYSTSELLHSMGESFLREFFDYPVSGNSFKTKGGHWLFSAQHSWDSPDTMRHAKKLTSREALIKLAEKVLVPQLGRENAFVIPTINKMLSDRPKLAVIETIGGNEWSLFQKELNKYPDLINYRMMNIRRESEDLNADYRELLPCPEAVDFWNNYQTKRELRAALKFQVKMMGFDL